jgi:hypothetical protein
MTWADLIARTKTQDLIKTLDLGHLSTDTSEPCDQDRAVAWQIYVELRTRISTQPLHFLDGDEETALTSLYNLFQPSRELLEKHGPEAYRAAAVVEAMLNKSVRRFTAKWHRKKVAGELIRDDACRELRAELRALQNELREYEQLLYAIATGQVLDAGATADQSPPKPCFGKPIPFDELLGLDGPMKGATSKEQIIAAEKQEVEDRRQAIGLARGSDDLVGLAISGGGIRSATFALGVVQGLVDRGILKRVDLLSTVSGGGYLGSFLSSMLNTSSPDCGPTADQIPFRPDIAGDSVAIRSLRNDSRYILPSTFWRWLTTIGQAAYGIVSNLVIFNTLVFACVLATHLWMTPDLPHIHDLVRDAKPFPFAVSSVTQGLWVSAACCLFVLPLFQRLARSSPSCLKRGGVWEWFTLGLFAVSIVVSAINLLPLAHYGYMQAVHGISGQLFAKTDGWSLGATWVLLLQVAGLVAARGQWLSQLVKKMPRVGKTVFTLLWLAGPALLVFVYFELCRAFFTTPSSIVIQVPLSAWKLGPFGLFVALLIGAGLYSLFVNVNLTSLHRFYRNRLAETYLLRYKNPGGVQVVDPQPLSKLREETNATAPYHLLNGALNLPHSQIAELRGRDCDLFLFSKHFCGSPVAGYHKTTDWEAADAHLDLGTAMAISGAAAAPQMGMGSIRGASFLLTMLNVRLGYWLRKPLGRLSTSWVSRMLMAPGPGYLLSEALNRMSLDAAYLNISDGGHVENLGLYELLRRRCRFIIAIDGECDPGLDCPSLMRLQQFAAVDMNVRIEMDVTRLRRGQFQPPNETSGKADNTSSATAQTAKTPGYSRGHFTVGRIHYPGCATGWLVYIKLSVTGNEPPYVMDYLRRYPEFPHQSTADQVFEEDQFEAYRRLGEHLTEDLFSDEILSEESVKAAGQGKLEIKDWYQQLASSFFRAEDKQATCQEEHA